MLLVSPAECSVPYPHGLIGTAFDYAIRLRLGQSTLSGTVAGRGIDRVEAVRAKYARLREQKPDLGFVQDIGVLKSGLELRRSFQKSLSDARHSATALARLSLIMARFEPLGRGAIWDPRDFPNTLEEVEGTISTGYVEDIARLVELAERRLDLGSMQKIRLNPTLGNEDLGADADLVADSCLYELKCSVQPTREWPLIIRQILGYLMLTEPRKLQVRSLAVYMARQGLVTTWKVEELIEGLGGDPMLLPQYRREFVKMCARNSLNLQARYAETTGEVLATDDAI